jgi:internalin A
MSEMALELIRQAKAEGWKRLDLGKTGIVGEVPAEIWELEELEELILAGIWLRPGEIDTYSISRNYGKENEIFSFPFPPQSLEESDTSKYQSSALGLQRLKKLVLSYSRVNDVTPLASLVSLEVLFLNDSTIKTIKPLNGLISLREVYLQNTEIGDISPLSNSPFLKELHLNNTPVTSITPLESLSHLRILYLPKAEVTDISALINLKHLEELCLDETLITDINPIRHHVKLKKLSLSGCSVEDLSPLCKLDQIQVLNIAETPIVDIEPLRNLIKLEHLKLSSTSVFDIAPLSNLVQLQQLYLNYTKIIDVAPLSHLFHLKHLSLVGTNISDISPLSQCKEIEKLYLGETKVNDVTPLMNFDSLQVCDLFRTKVADISPLKKQIQTGLRVTVKGIFSHGIYLGGCPLTNPPYEIAYQGNKAILNYWRDRDNEKAIPATELKLFLVGNTTAGKSSLAHVLTKKKFPKKIRSTFGANLNQVWKLANQRIYIWDFGGQEYFHATHQLLVNDNALYIVLVDPKTNHDGFIDTPIWHFSETEPRLEHLEHFHHRYWLEMVNANAPRAQVLLFWNKMTEKHYYRDARIEDDDHEIFKVGAPLSDFKNDLLLAIKEKNPYWLRRWDDFCQELTEAIDEHLKKREVLTFWPHIRDRLAFLSQTRIRVPRKEFDDICLDKNPNRNLDNIITYLRDMVGRILYWERPELSHYVYIHPHNIHYLIYAILSRQVIDQKGRFTFIQAQAQIEKALEEIDSKGLFALGSMEEFTGELLQIMKEFELIFEVKTDALGAAQEFIAPQYLAHEEPTQLTREKRIANLSIGFFIRFTSYIPRHIIPRFIAKNGMFAKEETWWKFGVLYFLDKKSNMALVQVDYKTRTIAIEISKDTDQLKHLADILTQLRELIGNDDCYELSLDGQFWHTIRELERPVSRDLRWMVKPDESDDIQEGSLSQSELLLLNLKEGRERGAKNEELHGITHQQLDHLYRFAQRFMNRINALHDQQSQLRDQLLSMLNRLDDKVNSVLTQQELSLEWLEQIDKTIVEGLLEHSATLREELEGLYPTPQGGQPLDHIKINLLKFAVTAIATFLADKATWLPMLDAISSETTPSGLGQAFNRLLQRIPRAPRK